MGFLQNTENNGGGGGSSKTNENLWTTCGCKNLIYKEDMEANLKVCPKCGAHHKLTCQERFITFFDNFYPLIFASGNGSFKIIPLDSLLNFDFYSILEFLVFRLTSITYGFFYIGFVFLFTYFFSSEVIFGRFNKYFIIII